MRSSGIVHGSLRFRAEPVRRRRAEQGPAGRRRSVDRDAGSGPSGPAAPVAGPDIDGDRRADLVVGADDAVAVLEDGTKRGPHRNRPGADRLLGYGCRRFRWRCIHDVAVIGGPSTATAARWCTRVVLAHPGRERRRSVTMRRACTGCPDQRSRRSPSGQPVGDHRIYPLSAVWGLVEGVGFLMAGMKNAVPVAVAGCGCGWRVLTQNTSVPGERRCRSSPELRWPSGT